MIKNAENRIIKLHVLFLTARSDELFLRYVGLLQFDWQTKQSKIWIN